MSAATPTTLNTEQAFTAEAVTLQRRMRFNPLRMLDPENLSLALDQFDIGILRYAALLWDAMTRRDDTLSFVVPQLENAIAGKPWGVFKVKNAPPAEAARHAAALEYFYGNVTAVNAFDRNERGGLHLLLRQMATAYGFRYAVHHFVWRPQPGKMIEVEGSAPVPALSAELEFVPLWFFENTTGTLRFLPFGGFGATGQEMDFQGEWMCSTGPGIMFAASICYVFKRLTFQDWTIYNERYSQQKVVGQTPESKESPQGQAMAQMVAEFNGDQGIVLYGSQPGDKLPISLLGPEGTASVDLFERFLDRQDRKMAVMFRGSDLRNMSREKDTTGVSAQTDETESLEIALCASIASTCREFIDRTVIRYCFGEGVDPLAYFGLPDMDGEDSRQLRESAGFLADRGVLVEANTIAERLGVTLTEDGDAALKAAGAATHAQDGTNGKDRTANARKAARLEELVEQALRSGNGEWKSSLHPRGGEGRFTAPVASLKDFLFKLKSNPGADIETSLGELSDKAKSRIKRAMGAEVGELWLDAHHFRHVSQIHPEITERHWHGLLDMVNNADAIRPSKEASNAVEIWKKGGGKWLFAAGAQRTRSESRLYLLTFKSKGEQGPK